MTPERLAEIKALLAAATPGPWSVHEGHRAVRVAPDRTLVHMFHGTPADQHFIAAAPAIIAELLAEVERLQQVVSIQNMAREIERTGHP